MKNPADLEKDYQEIKKLANQDLAAFSICRKAFIDYFSPITWVWKKVIDIFRNFR